MLLADSSPSGEWNIEARIDGEAAGMHSFIVTGSPIMAAPRSTVRQPLSNSEMYKTAMDAAVMIERLAADGSAFGKSSGFWIDDGVVLTTFSALDSARSLRIRNRAGSSVTTDQVLAWNRWQDWAILHVTANTPAKLKRGPSDPVSVGDHSVFPEWGAAGAKLADGSITGINSFPTAGERLLVASGATSQSVGGALLNEFGDCVGMIVGDMAPGGGNDENPELMNATSSLGVMAVGIYRLDLLLGGETVWRNFFRITE
jgi:S1-C subfamily serine protease